MTRYFYAATCAPVRKPEEARRPGSVLEEPYPGITHQGERRRGGQHTECCLSAAGAESPGLSPEASTVGRFARWSASGWLVSWSCLPNSALPLCQGWYNVSRPI